MSTWVLNLLFAAVLGLTSVVALALAVAGPLRALVGTRSARGASGQVGRAGQVRRGGRVHPAILGVVIPLAVLWAVATAYMTLRTGTGLGVRLNLLPLLFDGRGSAVDAVLNLFVFVPLGLLAAVAGARFRVLLLLAFAATLSIEVAQYAMDAGRTADINDIITNVTGACVGWLVAHLILRGRAGMAGPRVQQTVPVSPVS
ncbi:VanZ family protein [Herbiconiux liukaitaii]|uniref:VanZ family protein n=1 Tax=Herbiconiux liukaitaii TaxID=3342799 RepID=UPI0035B8AE7F